MVSLDLQKARDIEICFYNLFKVLNIIDILTNISAWSQSVIVKVGLWTTNETWLENDEIKLDFVPSYPMCKIFDIQDFFDLKNFTPFKLFLYLKQTDGTFVTFQFEERNKRLRRALQSLQKSYVGPVLKMDLSKPTKIAALLTFSQIFNTDQDVDKPCSLYSSTTQYSSFGDCDEHFVHKEVLEKYGLIPFWATRSLDEVTGKKLFSEYPGALYDYFDGTKASTCLNPCLMTKVFFCETLMILIVC